MDVADAFAESDLLPISALQHLAFCERQCALIHIEGIWEENRLTAEGRLLHEKVHEEEGEVRGDVRTARAVRLRSLRLGIAGMADVVEFHRAMPDASPDQVCRLPGVEGGWTVFPVEHKRGKPKPDECDEIQLCAQAVCLEEMLGARIARGALYYGRPRRRHDVELDAGLRCRMEECVARLRALLQAGRTPPAAYAPRCENCSLVERCMPDIAAKAGAVAQYTDRLIADALKGAM